MKIFLHLAIFGLAQCSLLVSQTVDCSHLFSDRECGIHYSLYNNGKEDIFNVTVSDKELFQLDMFSEIRGQTSVRYPLIEGGRSSMHAIVFTPNSKAVEDSELFLKLLKAPVLVNYRSADSTPLSVYSTEATIPSGSNVVYPKSLFERLYAPKLNIWLSFAAIFGIPTFIALLLRYSFKRNYSTKAKS